MDFAYLRELCDYWADEYDWSSTERALNGLVELARRRNPLHLGARRETGRGCRSCCIHGWPGAPIEFLELIPLLVGAGHDVVVPSLPGFAFSDVPVRAAQRRGDLGAPAPSDGRPRLRALRRAGRRLGIDHRRADRLRRPRRGRRASPQHPRRAAAAGELRRPADEPTAETRVRRRRCSAGCVRGAFHLLAQGAASDALAPAFNDSPAGLAAWLVDKYRRWSDCDGDVERRFSKDDICDLLTIYWATETITSSMRTYAAEARDRWRFEPGERDRGADRRRRLPGRDHAAAARVGRSATSTTCVAGRASIAAATSRPSRSRSCSPQDVNEFLAEL